MQHARAYCKQPSVAVGTHQRIITPDTQMARMYTGVPTAGQGLPYSAITQTYVRASLENRDRAATWASRAVTKHGMQGNVPMGYVVGNDMLGGIGKVDNYAQGGAYIGPAPAWFSNNLDGTSRLFRRDGNLPRILLDPTPVLPSEVPSNAPGLDPVAPSVSTQFTSERDIATRPPAAHGLMTAGQGVSNNPQYERHEAYRNVRKGVPYDNRLKETPRATVHKTMERRYGINGFHANPTADMGPTLGLPARAPRGVRC
jgi:hypothetical protein